MKHSEILSQTALTCRRFAGVGLIGLGLLATGLSGCTVVTTEVQVPYSCQGDECAKVQVGGANEDGTGFVDWSSGTFSPKVITGPQGGQHVWVSTKSIRVSPTKLRIGVIMHDAETGDLVKPGRVEMTHTPAKNAEGWYEYDGIPAFVKEPCVISGRKLKVDLDISDLYGVTASTSAFITPHFDLWCPDKASADAGSTDAASPDFSTRK